MTNLERYRLQLANCCRFTVPTKEQVRVKTGIEKERMERESNEQMWKELKGE